MIHTTTDFFNKSATDIRAKYFPNEKHGFTQNEKYHAANYALELFNNGCLTYRQLMSRLAKACGDKAFNIHSIIEKHISSFGSYTFKPSKS